MKQKQAILAVVIVIATLIGTTWAQNINQAQKRFDSFTQVYQEALELNKDRFTNLDLIQIGDTVLLPNLFAPGVVAWIADEPMNGQHDCIWILSEKHWQENLTTLPADTIRVTITPPIKEPAKVEKRLTAWQTFWGVIGLIWCVIVLIFLILLVRHLLSEKQRKTDPETYPPVGENIDRMSRTEAVSSLSSLQRFLRAGEKIINLQRGEIRRSYGPKRIKVNMAFGDEQRREVILKPGERVARVIIQSATGGQRIIMLRSACSNGFGNDEFTLPDGWYFTPDNLPAEQSGIVENAPQATEMAQVQPNTETVEEIASPIVTSKNPATNLDKELDPEMFYSLAYFLSEAKEMDPNDFSVFEIQANFEAGKKYGVTVKIKK